MFVLLQLISHYKRLGAFKWLEEEIADIKNIYDIEAFERMIRKDHGVELTDYQFDVLKKCVLERKTWKSAFEIHKIQ